jgi:hypothetical protein
MKGTNPWDSLKGKKKQGLPPPKFGVGKFGVSRVGNQRPGARGK